MPDETPRLGVPFPLPEDAVTDYPALAAELAETIEAAIWPAVAGLVGADGTAVGGAGFTSQRNDAGRYTITFLEPFTTTPILLVTPVAITGTEVAFANGQTADWVGVGINGLAGEGPIDRTFNFLAILPPGGSTAALDPTLVESELRPAEVDPEL